ncbi:ABCB family ABC transporter ATP-binding protein/permease [Legionella pneumophila]|uniref:ABCB family ABC transporter ATP-binding protein/permease n=1 Tax=Legionella pneumophila TaxID=446 RepID=UPI000787D609|nr:ATP-binding cassette domain-containing protein [Legionella pneumophila]HAU0003548.1 ABC transporter ATP-binding protein/permease [Legionella pneumophila]HBD7450819.1 ABC transporter ATP-binding protein/permease [Legionella pneumophila]
MMNESLPSIKETIYYLWPCVWTKNSLRGKIHVVLALLFILISIALNLCVPIFLKEAINALSGHALFLNSTPLVIILTYASVWGASKACITLSQVIAFPVELEGARKFCLELFDHVQALSTKFHRERKSGEILTIIERSHSSAVDLIGRPIVMILPVLIEIIFAMIFLSYFYDLFFGLALLLMLVSYILLSYYTAQWIVKCRMKQNNEDASANAYLVESLLHADTVKYFNTQQDEINTAAQKLQEKACADTRALNADAKIHLMQNVIVGMCVIIMLLLAGSRVIAGSMNVGDFVLVHGYLFMFMLPLSMLGYRIRVTRDDLARFQTAIQLLKIPIDIQDQPNARTLKYKEGKIQFDHVHFTYNEHRKILDDVSFIVEPGTTTAIVGSSGSGKSTLARLIFRLYDLNSGSIQIDGQNISNIQHASLRAILGIVPQETALFNDTLRNNLIYGNPHVTHDELADAIQAVHLDRFVAKLPDGLETRVGERGLKLSGGEKQRVAIARMLLKKPKIFIFDEATSSLDMKTEKDIQTCLKQISINTTTLIIAHRLSTVTHADNILVLAKGVIIEQGTHNELLNQNGAYAQLWKAQSQNKIDTGSINGFVP